jgi:membrane protein YdbS with pleckstrin-like domain
METEWISERIAAGQENKKNLPLSFILYTAMYSLFKKIFLLLLHSPSYPPAPPAGSHDSLVMFRASPSWLRYRLLTVWARLIVYAISGFGGLLFTFLDAKRHFQLSTITIIALVFAFFLVEALIRYCMTRLDYDMRYYIITDRSLRIREGVWEVREITLTFENIQNMTIAQGPLQRFFGVFDLVVQTAGGGNGVVAPAQKGELPRQSHQAVFRGLERPVELRDKIMQYLKLVRSAGLGDHEERTHVAAAIPSNEEMLAVLRDIAALTADWRKSATN